MKKIDYSIVIPVFYNAGSLKYTLERIENEVFSSVSDRVGEVVFIDDGSGDESLEELRLLCEESKSIIRVIKLSRNFGQINAIWCGLEHTEERPVIIISADGQDPVGLIPRMLDEHFNGKKEIVIATRESRDESGWRKLTSSLVYGIIRKLGNRAMPMGGFDFLLIGSKAKAALVSQWQPNTFFQVRVLDLGFSRAFIPYHRESRKAGVSKWTLGKKMTYTIDGVLGHSYVPIRFMSVLGLLFSSVSFLLALFFLVAYFFNPAVIPGWTPIVLLILFIGGIQMLMIGAIGENLWRVLSQSRKNPPYIIETKFASEK